MSRPSPQQIKERLNEWFKYYQYWSIAHYTLGLTATIGTVFVAAHSGGNLVCESKDYNSTISIVVAVCTSILTFAKASARANAYIEAWRLLDVERIAFELDPNYSEVKLVEILKRGEAIIATTDK